MGRPFLAKTLLTTCHKGNNQEDTCRPGFNKALALNFPLTILTTTPLDTWCCPGSIKCQGSPGVRKSKPYEPCRVQIFLEYPQNLLDFLPNLDI